MSFPAQTVNILLTALSLCSILLMFAINVCRCNIMNNNENNTTQAVAENITPEKKKSSFLIAST